MIVIGGSVFVRSAVPVVDESLCAAQGYGMGIGANLLAGSTVVSPAHAALFCGSFAAVEKIINLFTCPVIPGPRCQIGLSPCGLNCKNFVASSISALIVANAMKVAGSIAAVPSAITVLGGLGVAMLATCIVAKSVLAVMNLFKSPEDQVKEIFSSTQHVNQVVSFSHEGNLYRIRFVYDPNVSSSNTALVSGGKSEARIIIAPEQAAPEQLVERVLELVPIKTGLLICQGTINGVPGFDCFANA